jgi:hypothetical protein
MIMIKVKLSLYHAVETHKVVRVRVSHIITDGQSVSQSVRLGVEPCVGLMTRYLFLCENYRPVQMWRPL